MSEYLQQVIACEQRRYRLDAAIAEMAAEPEWASLVSRIGAVRGVGTVTAFSVAAEIGDFSRFPSATAFMSYLGLVPSEDSTGGKVSRGPITRTGNGHVRTLLVEAAWHHARRWSPLSPTETAKRFGIGPQGRSCCAAANRRLHSKAERLRKRGMQASKANVAVARELAGFSGRWPSAKADHTDSPGGPQGRRWGNPRTSYAQPFGVMRGTRRRHPAPDKSECATQRADVRLEIAEAVWLNAPKDTRSRT